MNGLINLCVIFLSLSARSKRERFLIFDCNYLAVHFVNLLCFSAAKYTAMYGYKEKTGIKKDRKILICNKEITVKICDLVFDSSSPA